MLLPLNEFSFQYSSRQNPCDTILLLDKHQYKSVFGSHRSSRGALNLLLVPYSCLPTFSRPLRMTPPKSRFKEETLRSLDWYQMLVKASILCSLLILSYLITLRRAGRHRSIQQGSSISQLYATSSCVDNMSIVLIDDYLLYSLYSTKEIKQKETNKEKHCK